MERLVGTPRAPDRHRAGAGPAEIARGRRRRGPRTRLGDRERTGEVSRFTVAARSTRAWPSWPRATASPAPRTDSRRSWTSSRPSPRPSPPSAIPPRASTSHVADSLVALELPAVRAARRIADLGSGGGFPGLALAIALPDAHVALVESVRRKCAFLAAAAAELGLANVEVVNARAEAWPDGIGRARPRRRPRAGAAARARGVRGSAARGRRGARGLEGAPRARRGGRRRAPRRRRSA